MKEGLVLGVPKNLALRLEGGYSLAMGLKAALPCLEEGLPILAVLVECTIRALAQVESALLHGRETVSLLSFLLSLLFSFYYGALRIVRPCWSCLRAVDRNEDLALLSLI